MRNVSRRALVVGRPGERRDPGQLGAPRFEAGDVAVPQVEVGSEEAGHDTLNRAA